MERPRTKDYEGRPELYDRDLFLYTIHLESQLQKDALIQLQQIERISNLEQENKEMIDIMDNCQSQINEYFNKLKNES